MSAGALALGRFMKPASKGKEEGETLKQRRRLHRVQHAADGDALPARARRGDGLLRQLDHPGPPQRRPLQQRLLPEADADVRRRRPAGHAPHRAPRPGRGAAADAGDPRRLALPAGRGAGDRLDRQRRQPLDRLRLPADPALRAGQGGADPLRRRPAGPQAEAGALDRRVHALPAGRRRGLPADHARARHGDDDGDRLRRRRHPDRRRRPPPRPRQDRPRDRRRGAAGDDRRALPDGPPDRLPANPGADAAGAGFQAARRRSRSAPAASSGSASATACRRPSTCPRPTPT